MTEPRPSHVVRVGVAQTLAWGSSYYLAAVLAVPIAAELGLPTAKVLLAFSLALLAMAAVSPWAGRAIDRGWPVLPASHLAIAAALVLLAQVQGPASLLAAWVLLGAAMGLGLYEAAFATLVRRHGPGSRGAITGVTLIAGFASTVGWPLSSAMASLWGWRGACLGWALLHIVLGLPLLAFLGWRRLASSASTPSPAERERAGVRVEASPAAPIAAANPNPPEPDPATAWRVALLLAAAFGLSRFVTTAASGLLPTLLMALGVGAAAAVAIGATMGPAQVAGRLADWFWLRRRPALTVARWASGVPAAALVALAVFGGPAALPVVLFYAPGNGVFTIVKGSLPLALFGPRGYGERLGWIAVPGNLLAAAAPAVMGLLLALSPRAAVAVLAVLALLAWALLLRLRPATAAPVPAANEASAPR
jgi:MFS family permease